MPSDVVSTIGSSSRDYTTPDAFMAATSSNNAVSDDERLIGRMYDDSVFTGGGGYWSGATVDSERYRMLDVFAGDEYDPVTDTGVRFEPDFITSFFFTAAENYMRVVGPLKIEFGSNSNTAPAAIRTTNSGGHIIDSVLVYSGTGSFTGGANCYGIGGGAQSWTGGPPTTVRNCIVVGSSGGLDYGIHGIDMMTVQNCVVVDVDLDGIALQDAGGGTESSVQNSIALGSGSEDFDIDGGSTISYCMSSDSTATGTGSVTSEVSADVFEDAANWDFRLTDGSSAIDAGTDLSGSFTTDFAGDTWGTDTGSWHMGAFDDALEAAGASGTIPPLAASGTIASPAGASESSGSVGPLAAAGTLASPSGTSAASGAIPSLAATGSVATPTGLSGAAEGVIDPVQGSPALAAPSGTTAGAGSIGPIEAPGAVATPSGTDATLGTIPPIQAATTVVALAGASASSGGIPPLLITSTVVPPSSLNPATGVIEPITGNAIVMAPGVSGFGVIDPIVAQALLGGLEFVHRFQGVQTMPVIRAALRRHIADQIRQITVTMADGSTATPRVLTAKPEKIKASEDLPIAVVRTPPADFGDCDDYLDYAKAQVTVEITCYIGAGGSEGVNGEDLTGVVLDSLDEGFLHPIQVQLAKGLGLRTRAEEGAPLSQADFPQFVREESDVYTDGRDVYAAGTLTILYEAELHYESVPGGTALDDFDTLRGPIDMGETEAAEQVLVQTTQP